MPLSIPLELNKCFNPLDARISEFEVFGEPEFVQNIPEMIIDPIIQKVGLFDPEIALSVAQIHHNRLLVLSERKLSLSNLSEIKYYLKSLEKIIAGRKIFVDRLPAKKEEAPVQPSTLIQLPENFKIADYNGVFTASLSISQSVLFFHYLKERKFTPDYSASSFGKLAEALFGRNERGIRDEYAKIHDHNQNKEKLTEFKEILEALLKDVETDLKEAR